MNTSARKSTAFILLLVLFLAGGIPQARAQRVLGQLETNTDQNMIPGDTVDSNKKRKKTVPVDVRSWTIDPIFGNRTEVDVDTLRHLFQNSDHNEGLTGHYNSLSNMGSPRLSRIYMERPDDEKFIFITPFDQFFVEDGAFRFYNTKSPYMNLTYNWAGTRTSGDDHFQALYTNNAGQRFNFGGLYHYIYGKGYYDNQSTSFMNGTFFASYIGDRYDLHFHYTHNFMKMKENGGIENDDYIENPEDLSQSYAANEIPTRLNNTWNRQEHDLIYLNHRYNLGFTHTDSDSIQGVHDVFVPVTSFFHTLQYRSFRKNYRSYENPVGDFYERQYLPGDSANIFDRFTEINNYVGVSLREGFNKYAVAGINAYVGFKFHRQNMPDTIAAGTGETTQTTRRKLSQHDIVVGGQIIRTQGRYLHYNIQGVFNLEGDEAGDFHLHGQGELNLPLLGDTAHVVLNALLSHEHPNPYYETYHSKYAWWDNDLSVTDRTRLGGALSFPKTHTNLSVAVENVKNLIYLADEGTASTITDGAYTHQIVVRQHSGNIQVLSAQLRQNFKLGPLHLDNEVTFQTTSDKDVLPLPTLNLYHNLYLDFRIAHVLDCELGADLMYFTEYFAPDYSPAVGLFTNQNVGNRIAIGNYPIVSAYANLHLKRTRFYVQYYHANQSDGHYFWAPHYPMNPHGVRFGISWNFYD